MTKYIILAFFSLANFASFDAGFVDAAYLGHGSWEDSLGNQGEYDTNITFINNHVISYYAWYDNAAGLELIFIPNADDTDIFSVSHAGNIVGDGECINFQCHYEVSWPDFYLEETYTFIGNNFHRTGHQELPDRDVSWEDLQILIE